MDNKNGYITPEEKNPKKKFICEICSFYSNNKKDFKRHCETIKHKKKTQNFIHGGLSKKPRSYSCSKCGKLYKHSSGLSKHRHKCKNKNLKDEEIKKNKEKKKMKTPALANTPFFSLAPQISTPLPPHPCALSQSCH